ncbi:MAG: 5-(carboxyamino)imidazole ribonucleotide mutase [Planctomycetota bacterium]|jgi:5-(carboxyamino)imidazole ribonucleotide mutase
MSKKKVAIVMGSDSDLPVAQKAIDILKRFEIPLEARVLSAHRSPEAAWEFSVGAAQEGFAVIIAVAGGAAALPGFIASATDLPVIAVPVPTGMAGGLDSLLSGVQMPGGVPVLSTGTNSGGPVNAAVAAARILALSDEELAGKLADYRKGLARGVGEKDEKVRRQS